jgi:AraC family transcriptional regulator
MNKNILKTIEDVLDFIEVKLTHNISLDEIAQMAYLSKYHLHRLLSHAVGQPLINYIRARKLSASIDLLMDSRNTILSVSAYFGFEHEQSYTRAFKKQFDIAPSRFRKETPMIALIEKADISHLKEIQDGVVFKPSIVFKPTIQLIGLKHKIDMADNMQNFTANQVGNDFYSKYRPFVKNTVQEHVYIGLTRFDSWTENAYSYYFPSVQVSSFDDIPAGMETNMLPESKYVVFKYIGGFHPMHLTIRHLEQIWSYIHRYVSCNKPSYYQSDLFHFEYIDENIATDHYCEVDIFIPIQSISFYSEQN